MEKKSLFKMVDSFLLKKPSLRLPAHNSLEELVETFNHFFIKKIGDIRGDLDALGSNWIPEERRNPGVFSFFSPVTLPELSSLILACPTKSSPRDPIPTSLLKELLPVLAPSLFRLVNLSLSTGVFPDEMKLALVTPLLKKSSLDPE